MNQPKAFCPKCKNEVVFQNISGALHRCPACGFEYEVTAAKFDSGAEPSAAGELLAFLGRLLLIMVALVVVGFAVLYAGCALVGHF